jgi:ATP-binding cassette subfamily B protein
VTAWLRTGRLLVKIGWETGPAVFLLYALVSASGFLTPLVFAFGLRPLVDGAVHRSTAPVVAGAVLTGLALALSVAAPAVYRWATVRMRERSVMVLQRRLLTLSNEAPRLEHFERPEFLDRLQVLKQGTDDLTMGLSLLVLGPLIAVDLVVTAVVLARVVPVLAVLPFIAIPATVLSRRAETLRRAAELDAAADRRTAQHLFDLASTAQSGREIRLYGLRDELLDRHLRASRAVHRRMTAALVRGAAVTSGSWLIFAAAYLGAIVLALRAAAAGRATPGDVALTLALATAVVSVTGQLSRLGGSALRVLTVSGHYHWLEGQAARRGPDRRITPPAKLGDGIRLDHVTFRYAGDARPALSDVSLWLPPGTVVALVGENGAGKTTLVKLLCGMYEPQEGQVLIDGVDLATLDLDAYRRLLSAGFQDFMRFELVVRDAVGIGDVGRVDPDDVVVRSALTKANAGFAERLPQGLDTQLGPAWTGGVDLSGGEWQKLALARSMMRPAPLLVVLDEPTASLDPQTEHLLFEQVAAGSRAGRADGRVTLLVSHRFSTVRMADLIVVLNDGGVRECGTHHELMTRNGVYAELFTLQAAGYR